MMVAYSFSLCVCDHQSVPSQIVSATAHSCMGEYSSFICLPMHGAVAQWHWVTTSFVCFSSYLCSTSHSLSIHEVEPDKERETLRTVTKWKFACARILLLLPHLTTFKLLVHTFMWWVGERRRKLREVRNWRRVTTFLVSDHQQANNYKWSCWWSTDTKNPAAAATCPLILGVYNSL